MEPGKMASQTGHAFLGAFLSPSNNPEVLKEYHSDFPKSPGTKICLKCPSLPALLQAEAEAIEEGIPTFKVIDSGCPNFFGGRPVITALGIGPCTKEQVHHITGKFRLL
jgi:peptidyl-tRNA hydrolase